MRDYIPKREFPYKLPRNVYYQALYAVRDYARVRSEYKEMLHASAPSDGQPHGSTPGDPTGKLAARRAELSDKLTAIDRALCEIPKEYRRGVADNVRYGAGYPLTMAGIATWSRYRRKFLYYVAKNLRLF